MIKDIVISVCQIYSQIFFCRKPEVIFYYPQHFNRSKDGTNPYFEPIIDLCKKNDINYIVLEEPSNKSLPRDKKSIKADYLLLISLLIHKVLIKGFKMSLHKSDCLIGRIVDTVTFHKLRATTYITISNSMIDVLGELNPQGNVYDLQHGIIYYGHPGYFMNLNELRPEFTKKNRRVFLWGNLYKNNLMNLPQGINSDDKFLVVGYPMYETIECVNNFDKRVVLVSLQFTSDIDEAKSRELLDMLGEFVVKAVEAGYRVLLKHHPRFAGEIDLNPLLTRYSGSVEVTAEPLAELARRVKLHVTWGSTTAMEFAAYGIPTYFLRDDRFDWATTTFYGQYSYPLYDGLSIAEVLNRMDNSDIYAEDCKTIKDWYESAYSPLNKDLLLKLLKGVKP